MLGALALANLNRRQKMAEGPTTLLEVQHMLIESAADLRRELDGQVEAAADALETC